MRDPALEVRVERAIACVAPDAWDAVTGGRPFASHRWLRLAESVAADLEPRYVLAVRAGELVGAAVCRVDRRGSPAAYERSALARTVARLVRPLLPTLACGLPVALRPGVLAPDSDGAADDAVPALLDGIWTLAAAERALSVRFSHVESGGPLAALVARAGYRPQAELPNVRLDVGWRDVAAYEAWLPHKRRSELRRVRSRARERGVTIAIAGPDADRDPRLRAMIAAVVRRHAPHDGWADDLLPRARAILGPDMTLLVAQCDGRPVGCLALLRSGGEMVLKWPGLDHDRAREALAYHALLGASVEHAIRTGVRRLWLGPTAYPAKRDLGGVEKPCTTFVRERGRVLHRIARAVVGRTGPAGPRAAAAPGAP